MIQFTIGYQDWADEDSKLVTGTVEMHVDDTVRFLICHGYRLFEGDVDSHLCG